MSAFPWHDLAVFGVGAFLGAIVTAFTVRDALHGIHRDLAKKIEGLRYGD